LNDVATEDRSALSLAQLPTPMQVSSADGVQDGMEWNGVFPTRRAVIFPRLSGHTVMPLIALPALGF
jgi:hypothetical protein